MELHRVDVKTYGIVTGFPTPFIITCAPSSDSDGADKFLREFFEFLRVMETQDHQWIISCLAPLRPDKLIPILEVASSYEKEISYWMSEAYKPSPWEPPHYSELSIVCDSLGFNEVLSPQGLNVDNDFCIGGWLAPRTRVLEMMKRNKFARGEFLFAVPEIIAAFMSVSDFDHIVVAPADQSIVSTIEKKYRLT